MRRLGRALPAARARIEADLSTRGLNRRRVLAAAVRLLDVGLFRVGGEEYAQSNGSSGLTTALRSHVRVERGPVLVFDYPAKSGRRLVQSVSDPDAVAVVRALLGRGDDAEKLLAYHVSRTWKNVESSEINEYLGEIVVEGRDGEGLPDLARHRAGRGGAGRVGRLVDEVRQAAGRSPGHA